MLLLLPPPSSLNSSLQHLPLAELGNSAPARQSRGKARPKRPRISAEALALVSQGVIMEGQVEAGRRGCLFETSIDGMDTI